MSSAYKSLFLLDPAIHFLNHGSFGACPRPVFKVYQELQRELESHPVQFLDREMNTRDLNARQALAQYLSVPVNDLVFVTNVTQAVNLVARSLDLRPGDEILTSDHEYGACDYIWEFICNKTGAIYTRKHIQLPAESPEEMAKGFWEGVTSHTKVIFLSHITSATALHLPVERIIPMARQAGIRAFIDGAHAPGQIPLELEKLGADFYTGNCHKWMLGPKGAGFLYARPEVQGLIEPLVVSWGYHATQEKSAGSRYLDGLLWTGTKDPAAALAVPAAIQFMDAHNWTKVQKDSHVLARQGIGHICELVGMEPLYPLDSEFFHQMGIASLPVETDTVMLKRRLYEEFAVEVPVIIWTGQGEDGRELLPKKFLRISVQCYNTPEDLDALYKGLTYLLPKLQG